VPGPWNNGIPEEWRTKARIKKQKLSFHHSNIPFFQYSNGGEAPMLYPAIALSLLILSSVDGCVLNRPARDLPERGFTMNIWAVA
jgi:hypothetical protein